MPPLAFGGAVSFLPTLADEVVPRVEDEHRFGVLPVVRRV
jgi:hypothetical protein